MLEDSTRAGPPRSTPAGRDLARVVAVLLGHDELPGATITRYCSSSLQTTRMAMHAIRAGEGDVFISAGVETVSRLAKGSSDSHPDTGTFLGEREIAVTSSVPGVESGTVYSESATRAGIVGEVGERPTG